MDPIMRGVASTLAKHVNVWEVTVQRLTQSPQKIKMNFKPCFSQSALHEMIFLNYNTSSLTSQTLYRLVPVWSLLHTLLVHLECFGISV